MNKTFIYICLLCIPTVLFAQIPNAGFENWTNNGSYDNPNDWQTLNSFTSPLSVYTATKGTPGSPGSSFLKLTSKTVGLSVVNGVAATGSIDPQTLTVVGGFPYSGQPVSFTGKYQHMIYGTSQGEMTATLTRWDPQTSQRIVVAVADQKLSGMAMSWTNFTIPFVYSDALAPDTCLIVLKASGDTPTNNDYLWVDNMSFSGSVANVLEENKDDVLVCNNPSSTIVQIRLLSDVKLSNVSLIDLTGKEQFTTLQIVGKEVVVDVSCLPEGEYLFVSHVKEFAPIRIRKVRE